MDKDLMLTPLVSVNMAVFNGEKYIKEAIDSILSQTYQNFELIIVDDGSHSDQSIQIAKSYNDSRIKLIINDKNRGLAYTRNKALEISKGKYVAVLDCDDIALPTRIEEQVTFLELNTDYAMVGSWVINIDESGKTKELWKLDLQDNLLKTKLFFSNYFAQSAVMIRKQAISKFSYSEEHAPAEDYYLWSQIAYEYKVGNLQKALIKYRTHSENISTREEVLQNECVKKVLEYHLKQLGKGFITQDEADFHYHIIMNTTNFDLCDRRSLKALEWLNKLQEENKKNKIYDSVYFTNELKNRYQQYFSSEKSYVHGLAVIPFLFSELNRPLTFEKKLRFFFKCLNYERIF